MALTVAAASTQVMGVALATDIGAGSIIELRTGAKPATPETAATGTLLASVTISGSFTSTTNGTLTAADPAAASVVASGTAAHFRLKKSGGTAVVDGTVGTSAADLIMPVVALIAGGTVDLGVPTINVPVV